MPQYPAKNSSLLQHLNRGYLDGFNSTLTKLNGKIKNSAFLHLVLGNTIKNRYQEN